MSVAILRRTSSPGRFLDNKSPSLCHRCFSYTDGGRQFAVFYNGSPTPLPLINCHPLYSIDLSFAHGFDNQK